MTRDIDEPVGQPKNAVGALDADWAGPVRDRIAELCRSQPLAVLATAGQAGAYASLVAVAVADDLRALLFATPRATRKYANLTADPRVSLLVDNRSNQASDFRDAMAATISGQAAEMHGPERDRLAELYAARHPYLADFVRSPTCALFKVAVRVYYVVDHFQTVVELHVKP